MDNKNIEWDDTYCVVPFDRGSVCNRLVWLFCCLIRRVVLVEEFTYGSADFQVVGFV